MRGTGVAWGARDRVAGHAQRCLARSDVYGRSVCCLYCPLPRVTSSVLCLRAASAPSRPLNLRVSLDHPGLRSSVSNAFSLRDRYATRLQAEKALAAGHGSRLTDTVMLGVQRVPDDEVHAGGNLT